MNTLSRILTGGAMIVGGLILLAMSFFFGFVSLFYGIPILIIGLIILFNKKEDEIEQIKSKGKLKSNERRKD